MEDIPGILITTSRLTLPVSVRDQHQYPTHHPNLPQFLGLFSPEPAQQRDGHVVIPVAIEEDHTTSSPATEFIVSINENLSETTTTGDEELAKSRPPIEFESPSNQDQLELITSLTMDVIDHAPSILTRDEQQTTGFHDYSDPKDIKFWLRLYEACLVLVVLKFIPEKHNPIADLFLKISVSLFAMAFIICNILSWIYTRLENSNSSYRNLSPGQYKMLKYVYYILCVLAHFLLLLVLLTSNPNPNPNTHHSPQP